MVFVHGVWSRRRTLALWVEHTGQPRARRPAATGRVHAGPRPHPGVGSVPAEAAARLGDVAPRLAAALLHPARASVDLLLPSTATGPVPSPGPVPGGAGLRPWRVPSVALNPDRAHAVLAEVHAALGPSLEGLVIADDLRWLAAVDARVAERVRAGLVVPDLVADAGAWWGRWAPRADAAWRVWCADAATSMPPVLRAEAAERSASTDGRRADDVLREVCEELTDLLVRTSADRAVGADGADGAHSEPGTADRADLARSPGTATPPAARAVEAWVESLRAGTEVTGATPAQLADLAAAVATWHASGAGAPVELLLRVTEPTAADTGADSASEHTTGDDTTGGWALQVRLRSLDDPSLVLTPDEVRGGVGGVVWDAVEDPWSFALTELGRAGAAYPPLLTDLGGAPGGDVPLTGGQVVDLVTHGVPALDAVGVAVQLPGRWLRPEVTLRLRASTADAGSAAVSGTARLGRDDLVDYSWQVALGNDSLTRAELEALAAAKEPLVRLRGQWVQIDAERLARSLRFLDRQGTGRASLGVVLGRLSSGHGAPPEPVAGIDATGWLGDLLSGRADARATPVPAPTTLHAQLRPYQERGLAWLAFMARLGLGAVLADDMGLGKTVQLLALLLAERDGQRDGQDPERDGGPERRPTLLVCPMSVVGNWQREAARFAPTLHVHVHHGPERHHGRELTTAVAAADLVITTYALVTRDVEDLAATSWQRVALDEAQHVKNSGTRAARAVRAVAAPTAADGPPAHRVALTGTPVENRLDELRSILDFTNPGLLGSVSAFRERFAVPIERHADEAATTLLATLTRPFVLRRLKTDPAVISDLPAKLEMVVRANLTAEQASLYQAVVDDMLARVAEADAAGGGVQRRGLVLATLTRLKQVCNHPAHLLADGSPLLRRGQHRSGKLALVDDVLDAVVADGERALCFTQYREFGAMLAPHLAARYGTDVPFLHGGVPRAGREAMVARFSGEDGPPVMLLSLKAGGTGLNLVAANHVIHLDRWWNPAVEDQATDRAFRIGQTKQVQVRKLVCVGTVEERIDALMTAKRELAELVVGTGEGWLTELSTADLRELLTLGADAVGD